MLKTALAELEVAREAFAQADAALAAAKPADIVAAERAVAAAADEFSDAAFRVLVAGELVGGGGDSPDAVAAREHIAACRAGLPVCDPMKTTRAQLAARKAQQGAA